MRARCFASAQLQLRANSLRVFACDTWRIGLAIHLLIPSVVGPAVVMSARGQQRRKGKSEIHVTKPESTLDMCA